MAKPIVDNDEVMVYQKYPATKNKWYADIPLDLISADFKKISLPLQEFTIPRIEIGTTEIAYGGSKIEIPNRTFNSGNKNIRFQYLIDSDWEAYLNLYQWAGCYSAVDNPTVTSPVNQRERTDAYWNIPINVYLVNEKRTKPTIIIKYSNCILKEFGEFVLSYKADPEVMSHSFTVAYSRLDIMRAN
jgi:hypothetical protein